MGFRKLLIFISVLSLISCSKHEVSSTIKEILYYEDTIAIKLLKNENKIGTVTEVYIGNNGGLSLLNELSFDETGEEIVISVNISENPEEFILDCSYPLEIKWIGGWIKGMCIYKGNSFIVTNEKYYNKTAF